MEGEKRKGREKKGKETGKERERGYILYFKYVYIYFYLEIMLRPLHKLFNTRKLFQ